MCGIFGYSVSAKVVPEFSRGILAYNLATYNDERGGHSWGLAGMDDGWTVKRGLGDLAPHVAHLGPYETAWAHTRWATTGAKTITNAHPFEIGRIVGAHNGVLINHEDLSRKYGRDFPVDSQHLIAHLDEGRDFDDVVGYGALEWVDREVPNRVYLCRLAGGSLSIAGVGKDVPNVKGVVWSSDAKHLRESCEAAGISVFTYECLEGVVYYVEGRRLYKTERRLKLARGQAARKSVSRPYGGWHDYFPDERDEDESTRAGGKKRGEALCPCAGCYDQEDPFTSPMSIYFRYCPKCVDADCAKNAECQKQYGARDGQVELLDPTDTDSPATRYFNKSGKRTWTKREMRAMRKIAKLQARRGGKAEDEQTKATETVPDGAKAGSLLS